MGRLKQLIEVAILSRGSGIYTKFDYYADSCVQIGQRVEVPFGKGSSIALGMVVGIDKEPEQNMEYKDVLQCIDETPVVDQIILDISKEIADDYLCSFQDAVDCFCQEEKRRHLTKQRLSFLWLHRSSGRNIYHLREKMLTLSWN